MRHINHQFKLVFWKVHTHNKAHLTSVIGKLLLLFLFMLSEANSLHKDDFTFFSPSMTDLQLTTSTQHVHFIGSSMNQEQSRMANLFTGRLLFSRLLYA